MICTSLDIKNNTNFRFSEVETEKAIVGVLKKQKIDGAFEIGLRLVTKSEIQELNKKYRQKDMPTDVLSFPIANNIDSHNADIPLLLGDIVVCPAVININAKKFKTTPDKEFIKMIQHSVLHLVGIHHDDD